MKHAAQRPALFNSFSLDKTCLSLVPLIRALMASAGRSLRHANRVEVLRFLWPINGISAEASASFKRKDVVVTTGGGFIWRLNYIWLPGAASANDILKDYLWEQITYVTLCVVDSTGHRMVFKTKNIQSLFLCSYMQRNTAVASCNMYSKLERSMEGFVFSVPWDHVAPSISWWRPKLGLKES